MSTTRSRAIDNASVDRSDASILSELDLLVRETYQLWDQEWVGFSWRNYTYDHVRRVRNLALSLASEEGADTRSLDFAATLHDITKSYDGEIMMRNGERVVDERGLWRNEYLPPARSNIVTWMYDELKLAGLVHHESGSRLADALLSERGFPAEFRAHVAEIIVSHLSVTEASSLEGRCLYDADTIDANLGHPALYRNIQISMRSLERQAAAEGTTVGLHMAERKQELLRQYVFKRWPEWVSVKQRDFVARMTTLAGRRRAVARIQLLQQTLAALQSEMGDLERALQSGYLAPIAYFMESRDNPSLAAELTILEARWPAGSGTGAAAFLEHLRRESAGEI